MTLQLWMALAAASFVMGIIPGPGVASIIGFAFSSGRRTALASVAGMAVGNTTAMSISLAGAGAILGSSATAFTILKWVGASYLIAVGLIAIVRSSDDREGRPAARPILAYKASGILRLSGSQIMLKRRDVLAADVRCPAESQTIV